MMKNDEVKTIRKPLTFNWVEIEKPNGVVELKCFHTQRNGMGKSRRIMTSFYAEPIDIEESKRLFEANRRCVVEHGGWEPVEGAEWSFINGRWVIDESFIRVAYG